MRFNVGDVVHIPGNNSFTWRIKNIVNDKYILEYKRLDENDWNDLHGNYDDHNTPDFELFNRFHQPVQQEVTIYTVFFKPNPNAPISCMSFTSSHSAQGYKVNVERAGYSVVAMKKFKTRI